MERLVTFHKKLFLAIFIFFILTLAFWWMTSQANGQSIQVYLDEEPIEFSVDPLIEHGTTLVQLRPLFETMGLELEWDHETKTIIGLNDEIEIVLRVKDPEATVNGQPIELAQPPNVIAGNTLVPIRFISESTGAEVGWNPYGPEILIYSELYMQEHALSRDDIQTAVDEKVAHMKQELENNIGRTYEPADGEVPDLNQLSGMYAGYRIDPDGQECGGLCWDIYSFYDGGKVVVGHPTHGGPETANCELDQCDTYTIEDGKMKLESGDTFRISEENGFLFIDDVLMSPVTPTENGLKLDDTYYYYGYDESLDQLSSWSFVFQFDDEGGFSKQFLQVGQVEGEVPGTEVLSPQSGKGTYTISDNTLTLNYDDGLVEQLLFFVHDHSNSGKLDDIQIGLYNFYVSTD